MICCEIIKQGLEIEGHRARTRMKDDSLASGGPSAVARNLHSLVFTVPLCRPPVYTHHCGRLKLPTDCWLLNIHPRSSQRPFPVPLGATEPQFTTTVLCRDSIPLLCCGLVPEEIACGGIQLMRYKEQCACHVSSRKGTCNEQIMLRVLRYATTVQHCGVPVAPFHYRYDLGLALEHR